MVGVEHTGLQRQHGLTGVLFQAETHTTHEGLSAKPWERQRPRSRDVTTYVFSEGRARVSHRTILGGLECFQMGPHVIRELLIPFQGTYACKSPQLCVPVHHICGEDKQKTKKNTRSAKASCDQLRVAFLWEVTRGSHSHSGCLAIQSEAVVDHGGGSEHRNPTATVNAGSRPAPRAGYPCARKLTPLRATRNPGISSVCTLMDQIVAPEVCKWTKTMLSIRCLGELLDRWFTGTVGAEYTS